jgi:hypothetical protein
MDGQKGFDFLGDALFRRMKKSLHNICTDCVLKRGIEYNGIGYVPCF